MCNINFIYNKKQKDKIQLAEVMNCMSFNSFLNNKDGEGFIAINEKGKVKTGKSKTKMVFLEASKFLLTHQRLATSGLDEEYIHPHETKSLILVHNGVFSGLAEGEKSDTRVYAERLEEEYKKQKGDLIKAIQELNSEVSGSYSIVVYEKKTGKAYYYKEFTTNAWMVENKDYFVMSTEKDNVKYAKLYLKMGKVEPKEIEEKIIYDIFDKFKNVGTFEEPKSTYVNYHQSYMNGGQSTLEVNVSRKYTPKKEYPSHRDFVEFFAEYFTATVTNFTDKIITVVVPNKEYEGFIALMPEAEMMKENRESRTMDIPKRVVKEIIEAEWSESSPNEGYSDEIPMTRREIVQEFSESSEERLLLRNGNWDWG